MAGLTDKIRIKDIAEMAGVSKGTVDRVLHHRGEVSEASQKKVEEVLRQIQYKPNVYASALASKKKYNLVCVVPEHGSGDYWSQVEEGILRQAVELQDINVSVKICYYNQYDPESCRALYEQFTQMNPDGVLLSPLFKELSQTVAHNLEQLQIPYVFVDSLVEGGSPLAYFGMHSVKSGHLAAKLLLQEHPEIEHVVMFHVIRKGGTGANQTVLRKEGFMSYVREHRPRCTVHSLSLHWNDELQNETILDRFFQEHPEVKAGVTFNSRVFMIADYFEKRGMKDVHLLGFDLLEPNVKALKRGVVSYLIAQRPEIQGYKALRALADYLVFKTEIPMFNYMPMDILTDENIDFYLNFTSI